MKGIFLTLAVLIAGLVIYNKWIGPKLAAAGFGFSEDGE